MSHEPEPWQTNAARPGEITAEIVRIETEIAELGRERTRARRLESLELRWRLIERERQLRAPVPRRQRLQLESLAANR